ncbi:O-antigen ligase family protein [Pseudomonas sp. ABC1]|uniref:O-antigen ligase family protein n=1 Tax=Pseudomonas sp. ABC1 TaxID=2748080 RepID=UPI0015C3BD55|nr:O-antigen ligase family protein [Pseudomonas sp. ABC1]QLF94163.1 O-antigen ligase family protein [Pseudomonas sp. ABC1]
MESKTFADNTVSWLRSLLLNTDLNRARTHWGVIVLLLLGFACLLLGIALPSSKFYHQLLIPFLWLPTLYLMVRRYGHWRERLSPVFLFSLAFLAWSAMSLAWGQAEDPGQESKHMLLIFLTLVAGLFLYQVPTGGLEAVLRLASYVMAALAVVCMVTAYILYELPFSFRLTSFWQLNHPILASHVFGFFAVALYQMRPHGQRHRLFWLLALAALGGFLLFAQSRGVWLALVASVLLAPLWQKAVFYRWIALLAVALTVLVFWLQPDMLVDRGLSYRPELAQLGLELFTAAPWIGIGAGSDYTLTVAGIGQSFDHPHNFFIGLAIELGAVGSIIWGCVWGATLLAGWRCRASGLGAALLGIWFFASIAFLTDGDASGLWSKPRELWFLSWIPLLLAISLAARKEPNRHSLP